MAVLVAGGSGLVGRALAARLLAEGQEVRVLTRELSRAPKGCYPLLYEDLADGLQGVSAVVNLAGEGIAEGRWTPQRKQALMDSRVRTTERLVTLMNRIPGERVLVNASAVGYYGSRGETVDEGSEPGEGFLSETCQAWEGAVLGLQRAREVRLRLGIVLSAAGGALPRMALPVKAFAGLVPGKGTQALPWIHTEDLVSLLCTAIQDDRYQGPINAVAPESVDARHFMGTLAKVLHRPLWPVPAILSTALLELAFGEMGRATMLEGAAVRPSRLLELGFAFRFPTLEGALRELYRIQ